MKTLITLLFLSSFAAYAGPYYAQQKGDTGPQGIQGVPGSSFDYMPEINLQYSPDVFSIAAGASTNFDDRGAYALGAGIPVFKQANVYGQVKSNGRSTEGFTGVTWRPGWTW